MSSPVWTAINFEHRGLQSDFARVPYSSDTSAYGWIPVPMICFKGSDGPTALLIAGTHGDEYEGQIALRRIARALTTTEIAGRVIILPALNQPAVIAGRRTSPLDGGNLNRVFPGSLTDGPTSMIADYVTRVLFPLSDYVVDLHSGGSSLDYFPVALAHRGKTPQQEKKICALLNSFGAPYSIRTDGTGGGGASTLYASAVENGLAAITTELGGGTGISQAGVALAEDGIRRILRHFCIAPNLAAPEAQTTKTVKMAPSSKTIYAKSAGLFEPIAQVGSSVKSGDIAGYMHSLVDTLLEPQVLRFEIDGTVTYRRFPALTCQGDALYGLTVGV
ncbi:succinylglutamate desuccinylase/aspartoacylase family protein [Sinorhizobium sp. Sb3]|uniref:succinylglutamate desuccinylase/aspartoacylase family protein n=1 Tax=Sinorhizobium sp. Sb3 TaxID=1358417 RepID=UPI00071C9EE8|nr:succinylglutamate desuccinylase/aspartoacylase family protein [Sinorhizobium sp. Sb3]